jgi:hypothetical protein
LYCFGTAEVCTYVEGGAHSVLLLLLLLRHKERAGKVPIFLPGMLPFISSHLISSTEYGIAKARRDWPRGPITALWHDLGMVGRVRDGGVHGHGQEMPVDL